MVGDRLIPKICEWLFPGTKKRCPDVGSWSECGSYYPALTCADELWDPNYLEACRELDAEFPSYRLLPAGSWSLGLSKTMKEACLAKMSERESEALAELSR